MLLIPNEVAWLAENVGKFSRTKMLDTPFGTYSELVIATALPMKESSFFGGATDAISATNQGMDANRDLGVWQISTRWHAAKLKIYRWWDPYDNSRMARLVYDETGRAFKTRLGAASGFTAWSVFNAADNEDPDKDPQWGAGNWHLMIAPATLGVETPFPPINQMTTAWRV